MSPMPSIWPTSRSGSNASSLSSFSPLPTNLIGTPGDLAHRKRGTAAGVAVELGQDHAVELERLVERLGRGDGVLAGHGVADEEDLVRLDLLLDLRQLGHQLVVDVQPAGRVEDQRVAARAVGLDQRLLADLDRVGLAWL